MIEVKNVTAGYDKKQILNGISFRVKEGDSLSIVGQNGCGKSTLLRVMCGTLDFDGEVLIDGKNIKKYKPKELAKKVSMLSQTTQIYFNYTVYDTVFMGRFPHQKGGLFSTATAEDREIVENALKVVEMYDFKDCTVDELSGGQLQRVFLAKIIAQDPDIVLLDEPTNHLDLVYQVELVEFLKKWGKEKNKTIVGVIHDLNLAMELSPKVLLMKSGAIANYGENQEVFTSSEFKSIYGLDVIKYMMKSYEKWNNIGTVLAESGV